MTSADVACWLLKSASDVPELGVAAAGVPVRLERCVRPSYRLELVVPGQAVLLWRSGRDAGVRAVGEVLRAPVEGAVLVRLRGLSSPVPRGELLVDARFRSAEVVRVPVGGNPSYLTSAQLAAVLERLAPIDASAWGAVQGGEAPGGVLWSGRRESNPRS